MGRTVVAEETIKSTLTSTETSQKLGVGLLVGQITDGKDLIGLAVRTPSLQEFNAEDDTDKGNDGVIDWWVVEHASQVDGLLPGGLYVVGVFVCCPSQLLPPLQVRLSKVLGDIGAGQEFKGHQAHQNLSLLHYCSVKKKFKCQTIDLRNPQAGFVSAEFKFKPHMKQWSKLEAVLDIDRECFIVPTSKDGQKERTARLSHSQAKTGVSELLEELQGAVVTLRGKMTLQDDNSLVKSSSKKSQSSSSSPSSSSSSPDVDVIQAALYLKRTHTGPSPPIAMPHARRVCLRGSMSLLAYVHPKATCAQARTAVRHDACRSLMSRIQAMVESSAQNDSVLEQLPMRVAVSVPSCHFPFTEYSLPHEETQGCVSRASDLLGLDSESVVAQPLEQFAQVDKTLASQHDEYGTVLKRYYTFASIFATIFVVLISMSVWIMLQ